MSDALPDGFTQFFLGQLDFDELAAALDPAAPLQPARVSFLSRDRVRLLGVEGMALLGTVFDPSDPTVVGDWVLVDRSGDPPLVTRRLRRTGVLRRRKPTGGIQPVAANLDLALICTAMGGELNVRRVERWLAVCAEADVSPLIVLNKADPGRDPTADVTALQATGADVIAVSALHGTGIPQIRSRLMPGQTATLLGSSGVGKSTLVNALLGVDAQATGSVRVGDDKGRHTTTARSLHAMPGNAFLIDNPGVREVGLVAAGGVTDSFPEIESLLGTCRYRGCRHRGEDGCALDAAVAAGTLDAARLAAWRVLQTEAVSQSRRIDKGIRADAQRKWKRTAQSHRERQDTVAWQDGQDG